MREVIINIIIVILPILIYFIYSVKEQTLNEKENNLFFEFFVITSLYLILSMDSLKELNNLLLNSFLIICFYKKKTIMSFILTIIIISIYSYINIYFIILYILIYLFYFIMYFKKYKFLGTIITYLSSLLFYIIFNIDLIYILSFISTNYILLGLIKKLDDIFNLYKSLDSINHDKMLFKSLFKISHEIKNPLSVCKGYLDMYDESNIETSKKYIPIVKEEVERTIYLLNDFLSISKLNMELDIIDINFLLSKLTNNLSMLFKQKNIKLITNIIDDEVFIDGDYNRLMQAFINILKNSVEAVTNDGVIELKDYIEDNNIIILFKDNGSGIEDIEKIKEVFYTTKQNGTGLGVPLTIEIIKKHNGKIDYDSSKNGTSVKVILPIINFNIS